MSNEDRPTDDGWRTPRWSNRDLSVIKLRHEDERRSWDSMMSQVGQAMGLPIGSNFMACLERAKELAPTSFTSDPPVMNARQGIKCGEIEVKRGGVMAILVSGGQLTQGSVERLLQFRESKADDVVILLEAEPFFDDGVAADVKIEIVNMQPDAARAVILERE